VQGKGFEPMITGKFTGKKHGSPVDNIFMSFVT